MLEQWPPQRENQEMEYEGILDDALWFLGLGPGSMVLWFGSEMAHTSLCYEHFSKL